MKALAVFGKFVPSFLKNHHDALSIATHVFGTHLSVSILFILNPELTQLSLFYVNTNSGFFEETHLNSLIPRDNSIIAKLGTETDILELVVSEGECDRLLQTCRACVTAKKRYNFRDILLYNVPFREPMELSLFKTETLHDTQAVILVLRECLDATNPLLRALNTVHSRTTMPSLLFETIFPHTVRVFPLPVARM